MYYLSMKRKQNEEFKRMKRLNKEQRSKWRQRNRIFLMLENNIRRESRRTVSIAEMGFSRVSKQFSGALSSQETTTLFWFLSNTLRVYLSILLQCRHIPLEYLLPFHSEFADVLVVLLVRHPFLKHSKSKKKAR